MGFGDLGNAIIIIVVFILLQFLLTLTAGITNIKNNWDLYKCNPAVMPFANVFGHDTMTTFDDCIRNSQVDFMSVFLEPIYASLYYFANNGAVFTEMFQRLKLFGNAENAALGDFGEITNHRLRALVDATNDVYININDSFSKLTSSMTILFNTIQTGLYIGEQSSCELVGTFISLATGSSPCNNSNGTPTERLRSRNVQVVS